MNPLIPASATALTLCLCAPATAAPVDTANELLKAVNATIAEVQLWESKREGRLQRNRAASALAAKAERDLPGGPFGPWGQCIAMASAHQTLVSAAGKVADQPPKSFDALGLVRMTWALRDHYSGCRKQVEQSSK